MFIQNCSVCKHCSCANAMSTAHYIVMTLSLGGADCMYILRAQLLIVQYRSMVPCRSDCRNELLHVRHECICQPSLMCESIYVFQIRLFTL